MSGVLGGIAQIAAPTNLLALFALGLLCGQNAARMPVVAPAAFAIGLFGGSVLVALAVRDPPVVLGLLALAAIAGLTVAIAWPLPAIVNHALALATGAALALNSPPQAISIPAAVAAQLATGVAALAGLTLVAFIAMKAQRDWQRIGIRIVGSWIAASAILVLVLRLVR
jgi:urease accessory protein